MNKYKVISIEDLVCDKAFIVKQLQTHGGFKTLGYVISVERYIKIKNVLQDMLRFEASTERITELLNELNFKENSRPTEEVIANTKNECLQEQLNETKSKLEEVRKNFWEFKQDINASLLKYIRLQRDITNYIRLSNRHYHETLKTESIIWSKAERKCEIEIRLRNTLKNKLSKLEVKV